MRHQKRTQKLVRYPGHRNAMLKNMALGIMEHQRIRTTKRRAKVAQRFIEKLITIGKGTDLASRRRAFDLLRDRTAVGELFNKIAPLFKARNGGCTRIIPLPGYRRGDGAEMVYLELVEKLAIPDKKKTKKAKAAKEEPKADLKAQEPEKAGEHAHELPPVKKTATKVLEVQKDKAKSEGEKLRKGFLRGIRSMFKGKSRGANRGG